MELAFSHHPVYCVGLSTLEAPRTEIETSVPFHAIGSLNTLMSVHQSRMSFDMHGKYPSATIERHQPQFVMSSFVAKAQIPTHLGITLAQTRIHTLHPGHPGNFDDVTDVASTWGARVGGAPKPFRRALSGRPDSARHGYELSRVQSKVQAAAITLWGCHKGSSHLQDPLTSQPM